MDREHRPSKPGVTGSSPVGRANKLRAFFDPNTQACSTFDHTESLGKSASVHRSFRERLACQPMAAAILAGIGTRFRLYRLCGFSRIVASWRAL